MSADSHELEPIPIYGAKKGVLLGMLSCILVMLIYIVDYKYLARFTTSMIILVVFLGLVVYFGIEYRKNTSGYISFGKAFQLAFLTLIVSSMISNVFNLVLYNVIDPELPALLTESVIANTESMLRSWGIPQDQLDQQILQMEKDIPKQFTMMGVLKNSWMFIVSSAVLGAIAGLIIKKNEPIING